MSNPTYVIKSNQFGYNDEYVYVCGSNIHSTFTDREEAENTYRLLEIQAARSIDRLDEVESIFEGDEEFRRQLAEFIGNKTGENYTFDLDDLVRGLPSSMSDEDVFTFVEMANMHAYQLLVFENEPKFYALWLPKDNQYYLEYDECYNNLVYCQSQDELLKQLNHLINYEWKNSKIEGELNEISDNPLLLEQLINTHKNLSYDQAKQTLTIKGSNAKTYLELNALLKQPFYEIRELSLQQVIDIEKQLEKEMLEQYEEY